ncbi:MAG: GntR family transcriptional regulator [Eubacteriales bacterium]
MSWKFNDSEPIFRQIFNRIRGMILRGELKPGDAVPTVRAIAEEAAVNPNTVQRALAELDSSGIVINNGTSGRTVTTDIRAIERERSAAAEELADRFSGAAESIGITAEQLLKLIIGKKEDNKNESC